MDDLQGDFEKKGIWRFINYLSPVPDIFQLSLDEGGTSLQEEGGIFFKREDFNPTGSLKDRGMAYQISSLISQKITSFVISSSGNAAISAAAYSRLAKTNLRVFVSSKINLEKLKKIQSYLPELVFSERPLSDSIKFAKENNFYNLRPSADPIGPEGYKTIAFELVQECPKIEDLFLPVSSGTCLVGLADGFKKVGLTPRIHACQSTKVFPIAGYFDRKFTKTESSLASALVAKITPRKEEAIRVIKSLKGSGWVISDGEIIKAREWLIKRKVITSEEGALSLAGAWKAGFPKKNGKTVCLLTGFDYN